MEIEKLMEIFLTSSATLESICIPIIGHLMSQYSKAREMNLKITSTYFMMTSITLVILIINSLMMVFLTFYFLGMLELDSVACAQFFNSIVILFLILILIIPTSLLYLWVKELKQFV